MGLSKYTWPNKILIFTLLACFNVTSTWAKIPNLATVEKGLLRGGRPAEVDFEYLNQNGIQTVLSLEVANTAAKEKRVVEAKGMRFISVPMTAYSAPSDRDVNLVLKYLNDKSLRPLFIHCLHGQDRTGLAVGLYRVESLNWEAQEAYDEMLNMGFHTKYESLDNYFKTRTQL